MMENYIYVNELRLYSGETIQQNYLVASVDQLESPLGIAYLEFRLQDKTGYVNATMWESEIKEEYLHYKGSIVNATGTICFHEGRPTLTLSDLKLSNDYDITNLVRTITSDQADFYYSTIMSYIERIQHKSFHDLLVAVYVEHEKTLRKSPTSLVKSGNYNGALIVQTVCLANMCFSTKQIMEKYAVGMVTYDLELLLTGCLLFSIGCIKLYTPFPVAIKHATSTLIPLSTLSVRIIQDTIYKSHIDMSDEDLNMLYHMIQTAFSKDSSYAMFPEALLLQQMFLSYKNVSQLNQVVSQYQKRTGSCYDPDAKFLYLKKRSDTNES